MIIGTNIAACTHTARTRSSTSIESPPQFQGEKTPYKLKKTCKKTSPGESPSRDHLTVRLCLTEKQETIPQIARRGRNHGSLSLFILIISFHLMLGYAVPVAASRGGTSLLAGTNKGECHEMLTVIASSSVGGVRSRFTSLYGHKLSQSPSRDECSFNLPATARGIEARTLLCPAPLTQGANHG